MSLHVLTIIDRRASRGTADWYFEDHAHFLRARKLAQEHGVFITDRTEFISDLDEFRTWIKETARSRRLDDPASVSRPYQA